MNNDKSFMWAIDIRNYPGAVQTRMSTGLFTQYGWSQFHISNMAVTFVGCHGVHRYAYSGHVHHLSWWTSYALKTSGTVFNER